MNKILDHFTTDWDAMTGTDWFGLCFSVLIFVLMVFVYGYVFHPGTKNKLEQFKDIPFREDKS